MYAVIETGGKQYRVEVGTELAVEYLDVEPGQPVTIDRVLLVADGAESSIGRPLVPDASVSAEVVRQDLSEKTVSFKYRPKARRRVKKGHRQELTVLRVTDVRLGDRSAAHEAREAAEAAKTERERLDEAAARQAAEDAAVAAKLAERTKKPDSAASGARSSGTTSRRAEETTKPAETGRKARAKPAGPADARSAAAEAPREAVEASPDDAAAAPAAGTGPAVAAEPPFESSQTGSDVTSEAGEPVESSSGSRETSVSTTDENTPAPSPRRGRTKKDE